MVIFLTSCHSSPNIDDNLGIIGGNFVTEEIHAEFFTHHVALIHCREEECEYICGGAVVSKNVTITAAHCFEGMLPGDKFFVRAGSLNATAGGITKNVSNVIIHPDYRKREQSDSDIAVLLLEDNFEFNEKVSAIRIANKGKIS